MNLLVETLTRWRVQSAVGLKQLMQSRRVGAASL
jgi:hypothetical protein